MVKKCKHKILTHTSTFHDLNIVYYYAWKCNAYMLTVKSRNLVLINTLFLYYTSNFVLLNLIDIVSKFKTLMNINIHKTIFLNKTIWIIIFKPMVLINVLTVYT